MLVVDVEFTADVLDAAQLEASGRLLPLLLLMQSSRAATVTGRRLLPVDIEARRTNTKPASK